VDRIGPRPAVIGGIVLAVAGFALFSRVDVLWQAYVTFAGLLGTGQMLVYLGGSVLIARAFSGERATAFGIAYAGLGIGTGLYAFAGQLLIDEMGWRNAALLLAFTPLLVVPGILRLHGPAAAVVPPAPSGSVAPPSSVAGPGALVRVAGASIGAFALIFFSSTMLGLMDEGVYQNLLPHAVVVGFSPTVGALALSLVSVSYVVAQLVGGVAADRFGTRRTALVAFGISAVGMAGVVTAGAGGPLAELLLLGSALLYGGGLAVLLLVRLAAFANRFAGPRFGFLSGIFALAYPIGGSFIVWFGGLSFDLWRGYLPAFAISAAGLVLATLALLVVSKWE
jgi:OFA family oxalate/formate antiporter-like MFS transporter